MHNRISKWFSTGKINIVKECWIWTGCKNTDGYPKVSFEGNCNGKGHRIVYSLYNPDTEIEGKIIRHKCDNPLCINPEHLEVGSPIDNVNDREVRGRTYNKVLPEEIEQVRVFRFEKHLIYKEIANIMGISIKRVEYILKKKLHM